MSQWLFEKYCRQIVISLNHKSANCSQSMYIVCVRILLIFCAHLLYNYQTAEVTVTFLFTNLNKVILSTVLAKHIRYRLICSDTWLRVVVSNCYWRRCFICIRNDFCGCLFSLILVGHKIRENMLFYSKSLFKSYSHVSIRFLLFSK